MDFILFFTTTHTNMKLILLLLCLSPALSSLAQNEFLVYAAKGNVLVVQKGTEAKARIGTLLSETDQVVIPAGATLSLICNQTSVFTLGAGKHKLADMGARCKVQDQSVSANYVKFVWTQLTQKPGIPEKNRKLFMSNIGAVSRAVNNVWIDPRMDTINFVSTDFPLSWKSYAEAEEFDFAVYIAPNDLQPIFHNATTVRQQKIADFKNMLEPGKFYYWTAAVKGDQNKERKLLNYIAPDQYKKMLREMEAMGPEGEGPAEKAFRLGFLLEQAHFLGEAYLHYQKAATLQPATPLFSSTLQAFKKDYGL